MSRRTPTRTLQLALLHLRALIARGVEFPDAHFQASYRYHLTEQQDRELVELYDRSELGHEGGHGRTCTIPAATPAKSHPGRR
ncbi:MAG: hypothetical protein HOP18_27185 [Deltaproteobacteria bacterium]|nr:hypothetical protein [Deltaproteobacteria bacterium]